MNAGMYIIINREGYCITKEPDGYSAFLSTFWKIPFVKTNEEPNFIFSMEEWEDFVKKHRDVVVNHDFMLLPVYFNANNTMIFP